MTAARADEPGADAAPFDLGPLQEENVRLRAQLHRILRDLEAHTDVDVRVDLAAGPDEAMVRVSPTPRTPLDSGGLAEVQEVAERLAHVQRDLRRIEQQVERLLWRVGEPAAPLAEVD